MAVEIGSTCADPDLELAGSDEAPIEYAIPLVTVEIAPQSTLVRRTNVSKLAAAMIEKALLDVGFTNVKVDRDFCTVEDTGGAVLYNVPPERLPTERYEPITKNLSRKVQRRMGHSEKV